MKENYPFNIAYKILRLNTILSYAVMVVILKSICKNDSNLIQRANTKKEAN